MIFLEQFHFLRPLWLLAIIPLVLLVWSILKKKIRSRAWESICDKELLPYILIGNTSNSSQLPAFLIALCGGLSILSLAGPVWERLPQPVYGTQSSLVIALDLSKSMDAADISPGRLARAKFKVSDILSKRLEGQIALLVYAGDVFTVTPLTDDTSTIELLLTSLTTEIVPAQGNRVDLALSKSVELLKQAGSRKGDILLITDEVDFQQAEPVVRALRNEGYRLSILGVGTPQGAPITQSDGSFLRDRSGQIVIPTLDDMPMRELTDIGGGLYQQIVTDDNDVDSLVRFFTSNFTEEDMLDTDFETDAWHERGPWLLVIILPFAAIVFRRGYLVLLISLILPYPQQLQAFEWDSLWLRPDQRALRALEKGEHETAAKLFQDPAWKGAANYRAGEYDEAIGLLDELEDIENHYNLGNALARNGMYEQAIAAYDRVLNQVPEHEDAKFNKELLEKEIENQDQQQSEDKDQQGDNEQEEQGEQEQQQSEDQSRQGENDQEQDQQQAQESGQDESGSEFDDLTQSELEQMMEEQANPQTRKSEQKLATEQWLRRVPDDPGGLLRRKFMYQYLQRQYEVAPGDKAW